MHAEMHACMHASACTHAEMHQAIHLMPRYNKRLTQIKLTHQMLSLNRLPVRSQTQRWTNRPSSNARSANQQKRQGRQNTDGNWQIENGKLWALCRKHYFGNGWCTISISDPPAILQLTPTILSSAPRLAFPIACIKFAYCSLASIGTWPAFCIFIAFL